EIQSPPKCPRRFIVATPEDGLRFALLLTLALWVGPVCAETAYISNELDNTVSIIDGATLTVKETIAVGRRPRGIELSADGKTLYVAVGDDDRIDVIDLATRKVTGALPSGE